MATPSGSRKPPRIHSPNLSPTVPQNSIISTEFAFVNEQSARKSRSHAMREHWKQRRRSTSLHTQLESPLSSRHDSLLPIHSSVPQESHLAAFSDDADTLGSNTSKSPKEMTTPLSSSGLPTQLITGASLALGSCRLDPFDQFPVTLTTQHHKLLLHWLTMLASMAFDNVSDFNPLRDVLLPLDLSNAASFNALMAHSASHLARMHAQARSKEALKFKAEAIRILSEWMTDQELAQGDLVLAALSSMLTYERYWGTEAEWAMHKNSLQRLVNQRGGIAKLRNNWRLQLPVFLTSLMAKPSWFDFSNQLWEMRDTSTSARSHPILSLDQALPRIRSVWIVSFIQDMHPLISSFLEPFPLSNIGYTNLQVVLASLYTSIHGTDHSTDGRNGTEHEFRRLACILFITLLLRSSMSNLQSEPITPARQHPHCSSPLTPLLELDTFLVTYEVHLIHPIEALYDALFYRFQSSCTHIRRYTLDLATILSYMSRNTRTGIERCLLKAITPVSALNWEDDNDWTPDALLSSLCSQ